MQTQVCPLISALRHNSYSLINTYILIKWKAYVDSLRAAKEHSLYDRWVDEWDQLAHKCDITFIPLCTASQKRTITKKREREKERGRESTQPCSTRLDKAAFSPKTTPATRVRKNNNCQIIKLYIPKMTFWLNIVLDCIILSITNATFLILS